MHKIVHCVVRSFDGQDQLVRIADSFNHVIGELVVTGRFVPFAIISGPYKSHTLTVFSRLGLSIVSRFGEFAEAELEAQLVERENEDVLEAA
jgi:hypothetical protein